MSQDVTRVSVEIGGTEISFETGKLAKQASGSVVVQAGDTMVLGTATAGNERDVDFLPLTVDVEERMYAAGKIPGSFFKREGRAGEKGTLTARMIDRPLRPLFPKGWHRETQLVSIPMSVDHVHPYDILAMNGASTALIISEIPFDTPVGAVRIGLDEDGGFIVNPDEEWIPESDLDLVVAGTDEAILMVEAGAKEVSEAVILDALDIAHGEIKKLCAAQRELQQKVGKEKVTLEAPQIDDSVLGQLKEQFGAKLDEATQVHDKLERQDATKAVEAAAIEALAGDPEAEDYAQKRAAAQLAFDKLEKETIRRRIAVDKKRPDGRAAEEIRDISIEVGIAPRTHGSALFTRGQTQAFSVAALGTTREEMRLDTLGLETVKHYFHHYNFPPFSVGEAGFMRGPKRRDIGHGALAERALVPVVPNVDEFPYTIRVVSDILESNGSSSMASVCGSTLSLLQAGVPLKGSVAGIAMGLIKEGDDYVVLSDIAGVEDHLGDMDFKVAGTEQGITALQMDIKITGVTFEILRDALSQAKEGRTFILGKMNEVISEPSSELSPYAPRITSIQIDTDKIGMVIGKGGETIRALSEEYDAQIDMQDDGTVLVYASNGEQGDALIERIRSMTKDVEVGDEFTGKVVKTTTFGAFVELSKGTDGLLHISNIKPGERVDTVEDVVNRGDEIAVKVVEVDRERGRIGLRLADDPDVAGKSPEELASVGTGGGGGGGGGGRDRDRGGRGGGRDRDRGGRGGRDRDRGPRGGGDGGGNGGDRGGDRGSRSSSHARDER
ncbi:MAG TPA: polyribonucleotide nucleotidyltransferase [Thermoleophilaceae bacterium]